MATYAIGDVQGCFQELNDLLSLIGFSAEHDQLWFAGDLVNRGPQSLETLRFIASLGDKAISVLGNHDIHMLAAVQTGKAHRKDTFGEIFSAPDRDELLDWLRRQPLFHHDQTLGYAMVHAGVAPQWNLNKIKSLAKEVESVLADEGYKEYLAIIYGNQPDIWSDALTGWDRLRCITNFFTRVRYCDQNGRMDFDQKGPPGSQTQDMLPWYEIKNRQSSELKIIFGHWSTHKLADINVTENNVFPIDTGCLWGGELTALRLDDGKIFQLDCKHRRTN
ncbi:MAG: symmetrical bis(5'-nucleosyl)-tetraphosphatase [Gammaproteobacteria bacterium]